MLAIPKYEASAGNGWNSNLHVGIEWCDALTFRTLSLSCFLRRASQALLIDCQCISRAAISSRLEGVLKGSAAEFIRGDAGQIEWLRVAHPLQKQNTGTP